MDPTFEQLTQQLKQEKERSQKFSVQLKKVENEIQHLSTAQGNLYQFQEKIEQQKTIYAQIAEIGHNFNESHDIQGVYKAVNRICLDLLNFEFFALVIRNSDTGRYDLHDFERADGTLKREKETLEFSNDFMILVQKYNMSFNSLTLSKEETPHFRNHFELDHFSFHSLGVVENAWEGCIVVGTSQENSDVYRSVTNDPDQEALFSNLTSLVLGARTTDQFLKAIQHERDQVKRLLDNMKQSIFTIDHQGVILEPVSKFTSELFKNEILGKKLVETVFKDVPSSSETKAGLETALATVFGEDDLQWMLMEESFPEKFHYKRPLGDKEEFLTLKMKVQPIWDEEDLLEKIMFVVEDITEIIRLEEQIRKERFEIEVIQQIVKNDLDNIADFFNKNLSYLKENLALFTKDKLTQDDFTLLMRNLHTIKGNSRLFGFTYLSGIVHDVETQVLQAKQEIMETSPLNQSPNHLKFANQVMDISNKLQTYTSVSKKYFNVPSNIKQFLGEALESIHLTSDHPESLEIHLKALQLVLPADSNLWIEESLTQWKDLQNESHLKELQDKIQNVLEQEQSNLHKGEDDESEYKSMEVAQSNIERVENRLKDLLANPDDQKLQKQALVAIKRIGEIPLVPFMRKFQTMVDEISAKIGKRIFFQVEGDDTTVNRETLSSLQDISVQLIRNSMDHGLESPKERSDAKKKEEGHISVHCLEESDLLRLTIKDDGRGIDPNKIADIALKKEVITQSEKETLGDQEKMMLIFRPGFSSKEEATDLSGRGVGMEIVKNIIEEMGGEIHLTSDLGKGTSFHITIPLQLQ